ncbi:hypothetical protein SAY87_030663 [Trapa incisa]|uniref:Fe2OG dioxygenase domain-containing protein n=1 Tax=Trapa incisa TaxID=236973 RepID=A0AAN7QKF6_9MYRT|nr:hypothetical protein SAY87_030663 [Trapa incisa]
MADFTIPTVDLSPFFEDPGDQSRQKKADDAIEIIREACSDYGFFQVVNHGVPEDLMRRALELSRAFFECSYEDKLKCRPYPGAPLPAGYSKQPDTSPDKNEYLLMFPPGSSLNIYPDYPPELREVLEQVFTYMAKTGMLLEDILNECLGLPKNFLRGYNADRSWDFMVALRYFEATEHENNGISEHEDSNCITFVFQDEVGGLEVRKNGVWIPLVPKKGHLVVNIGDVIRVLTNNKFKSATHRVVRSKGQFRHSYAFFYNLQVCTTTSSISSTI